MKPKLKKPETHIAQLLFNHHHLQSSGHYEVDLHGLITASDPLFRMQGTQTEQQRMMEANLPFFLTRLTATACFLECHTFQLRSNHDNK